MFFLNSPYRLHYSLSAIISDSKTSIAIRLVCFFLIFSMTELSAQTVDTSCLSDLTFQTKLDGDLECDPGESASRACDANHRKPSSAWLNCHEAIRKCRSRVFDANSLIYEHNARVTRCQNKIRQLRWRLPRLEGHSLEVVLADGYSGVR